MPVNLVSEDDLRAALHPFRVDAKTFEANVRKRLEQARQQRLLDPLAGLSPFSKAAAALIPLQIFAQGNVGIVAVKQAPVWFGYKLLSYLAFPAICLFLLVGASIFSLKSIRKIQRTNLPEVEGDEATQQALAQWGRDHRGGIWLVVAALLLLTWFHFTWLMFVGCIVSCGLMLCVLSSLAKAGLGNRQVIARSLGMGLMFLAQATAGPGAGNDGVHFLDQGLVAAALYCGVSILLGFYGGRRVQLQKLSKIPVWFLTVLMIEALSALAVWFIDPDQSYCLIVSIVLGCTSILLALLNLRSFVNRRPIAWIGQRWFAGTVVVFAIPVLTAWISALLTPVPAAEIKRYVESFDVELRGGAVSYRSLASHEWQNPITRSEWEIPARWVVDSKVAHDFSNPRRILENGIAGAQNPYLLGVAFRVGLVQSDDLVKLRDYAKERQALLDDPNHVLEKLPITGLEQLDWVIRAAVMQNELSDEQRDYLATRLNVTMQQLETDEYQKLEEVLLITELLDVIQRPIDRDRYQSRVHAWLRRHQDLTSRYHIAGGFTEYVVQDEKLNWGSLASTSDAIRLMSIYGIPDGMNLNLVRSFLREKPFWLVRDKWTRAAILDQLNQLPGVTSPSLFQYLYYEQTLLAALVLIAMCLYATFTSPIVELKATETEPANSPS